MPIPTLTKISFPRANSVPQAVVAKIPPELCGDILDKHNTHNRPLTKRKIERMQEAFHLGGNQCRMTTNAIGFDVKRRLVDGQTRLAACRDMNIPFVGAILFNMPEDTFEFEDQGRRRSPGDTLSVLGYSSAGHVGSAALAWEIIRTRDPNVRVTNHYIRQIVENVGDLPECVSFVHHERIQDLWSIGKAAGLLSHARLRHPDKADAFISAVANGAGSVRGDAAWHFRRRLLHVKSSTVDRFTHYADLHLAVRFWNKWIEGDHSTVRLVRNSEWPDMK